MPAMLAGKILGLMANIIFPEWLIVIIFIAVMVNDFIGTLQYYKGTAPQHPCGCSAPNPNKKNNVTNGNINEIEHQVVLSNDSNDRTDNSTNEAETKYENKECGAVNCKASVKYQSLPESEKESTKIEINDN